MVFTISHKSPTFNIPNLVLKHNLNMIIMRKIYLFLISLLCFQFISIAQTDIVIGTGTIGNTGTTYPAPMQDYYEGSRAQYLYLASELAAAGMAAGPVTKIKFEVTNLNTFTGFSEQMEVKIGGTAVATLSAATWEAGAVSVFGPVDFVPVLGTNEITFSTPYVWNGTDNILIEICNGDPNNGTAGVTTYTNNVTVPWTTGLSFNGSHNYRADNLGNLCASATVTNTGLQTTRPNITFVATAATCLPPSALTLANITSSGADVSWTAPTTTVTQYNWEVRSSGLPGSGATGLATSGNATGVTALPTTLLPATKYTFYVRSDCGAGSFSGWNSVTFTTLCVAVNSFTENFDAVVIPALPTCWARVGTTGTVNTQATNSASAPNTLLINSSSITNQGIVTMPAVTNAGAGTYRLVFKARASGTVGGILEVGYMTDPTDPLTFTSIQSVTANTLTYQSFIIEPGTAPGTAQVLAFRHAGAPANAILIDDVKWELIPSCASPTALIISNTTATGAQLDWTAPTSGTPTGYDVYVSSNNTLPTSTTTPTITGITGTTTNITSLTGSTKYYFYVRTVCGASGNSLWTDIDSFFTQCVAVSTFTENFDGVAAPALPLCWKKVGTTGTTNTQTTNPASVPNCLYIFGTAATNQLTIAMPAVSNAGAGTHRLVFKARANFTVGGIFEVGYLTDPTDATTFNVIQSLTASSLTYQSFSVEPGTAPGTAEVLAFRHVGTPATSILIDDVLWEPLPACNVPTALTISNVTTTTAQLDWTAPTAGSPTGYQVYLSTSNTLPTSTTTPTFTGITTTTTNLTSLTSATKYYFYVRSDCGASGTSNWSGIDSFSTSCNPTAIPYTQDFQSGVSLPLCTSTENAGTGNNWAVVATTGFGFTPNSITYTYNSTNAADAWFYTRGMNLTAGVSYRLSFKYGNNNTIYTESLEAKYGSSPSSTAMSNLIVDYPTINTAVANNSVTDFTPATTGVYYVGFHAYSIADQDVLLLDDISVTLTPTCDVPTAIVKSNLTATGIQLDWTAPLVGTPTSYQIYYSTNNTVPTSTTTPSVTGITGLTSNLTGLVSATKYYYYLRTVCGASGNSPWTAIDSFTTNCGSVTSFSENFDGVTVPALPICWSKVGTTGTINTQTANPSSSPNTLYIFGTSATDQAIVSMPPVSNAGSGTHRLVFNGRANFTVGGIFEVGYLTDPTDATTFTVLQSLTASSLTYQSFTVEPGTAPGTAQVLAFRHVGVPATSILIDDVKWEPLPACNIPTALAISTVTTTSAILNWTSPSVGTPTGYQVYISTSNTLPTSTTTPTLTGISSNTANLTSLTPATKYYFYVRSDCGAAGTSTWTAIDSFTTNCDPTVIPYSENFQSGVSLPLCTSTENAGTGNNWAVAAYTGNGFTPNSLVYNYNATNAANAWFYTRGLNLTGGVTYRLSFKYGNNNTLYTESLEAKYGTSPSSATMSNLLVDYPAINSAVSNNSVTDFTPATSGVYYIGFHAYSIADQDALLVDDIAVTLTPTCDFPTAIVKSNITSSGVKLDWSVPATGTPTGYQIYYSTNNTLPTSTTTPSVTGITGLTSTLTGLTSATKYYYYLRTDCGASGNSPWTTIDSFVTACDAVPAFSQNFDGVTAPALPICWNRVGNVATGRTQTASPNSAPNTLYIYSASTTALAVVAMQPVTGASTSTNWLKFNARANFTVGGVIEVGYLTNPADSSTFTVITPVTITSLTYQSYNVVPGTIAGTVVYLAFRHTGSPANSVLIDDVNWEPIPGCIEPSAIVASGITGTDAILNWTAPGGTPPASYDIYYSTTNTAPISTTTPTIAGVTTTSSPLTGLSASTAYFVWIRSNCGTSGISNWTSAYTFSTACGVIVAPTSSAQLFTVIPPACWSRAQGVIASPTTFTSTTTSNWVLDDFGNVTTPVNKCAKINIFGTTRREWLITPSYDLGTGGNFKLEFDLALTTFAATTANTLGADDKFAVVISTDNGVTWDLVNVLRLWDASTAISNTGERIAIPLTTYTGIVKFAFYGESTISNADNDLFVDNFELKPSGVVPVTLSTFKGERQGSVNVLSWNTATELSNKGFEIQRSVDGINFTSLGYIASKAISGNSNSNLNYSFVDEKPFSSTSYYRLKQVNIDGRSRYSTVVSIKGTKSSSITVVNVYPNPASKSLSVIIASPVNENINVLVTDLAGRVIQNLTQSIVAGDNKININVQSLSSGTYLIKTICENGCEASVSKFVKR